MRQVRRRVAIAAGILIFAGATSVAFAQPNIAQRGQQAGAGSFLPGFRLPPEMQRPQVAQRPQMPQRRAAPAVHAQQPRQVRLSRTSHQAVQTQPSHRAVERGGAQSAHVATPIPSGLGRPRASALVAEARRYLGTNPTGRARLWCARFVNFVLAKVGQPGTGSDAAKSFALYGRRISTPQYGAIAVLTRKGGGHVGIVTGVDRKGNPILIAGNNGRRKVGISVYPKRRVIAYVMPDGTGPGTKRRYASAKPGR